MGGVMEWHARVQVIRGGAQSYARQTTRHRGPRASSAASRLCSGWRRSPGAGDKRGWHRVAAVAGGRQPGRRQLLRLLVAAVGSIDAAVVEDHDRDGQVVPAAGAVQGQGWALAAVHSTGQYTRGSAQCRRRCNRHSAHTIMHGCLATSLPWRPAQRSVASAAAPLHPGRPLPHLHMVSTSMPLNPKALSPSTATTCRPRSAVAAAMA